MFPVDEGPFCPICGESAETFYYSKKDPDRECIGCNHCIYERPYWDVDDDIKPKEVKRSDF